MRIGISVLTHAGQSIWENGLGQNVIFFVKLLRKIPFVTDVVLLNCGDQTDLPPEAEKAGVEAKLVTLADATDTVDIVFEMGGGLPVEWLDHMRGRGRKVVFFCCGQPYVGLIEPTVFKKAGYVARSTRCDAIWVLAKDRALMPFLRTLHRCPVVEVPFLWDPMFINQRIRDVEAAGERFGYRPAHGAAAPRALRAAIVEPNISVVKSGTIPLLICESAFRQNAASIDRVHLLNGAHMQSHPTFSFLVNSLDLNSSGRLHVSHRHDFAGYVSQHVDAIVSHQWENNQNIAYLDALYGGYPIIHNSSWLGSVGYFYPDSDIEEGARQLINAAHTHDAKLGDYVTQAQDFLARLSPAHPHNQSEYARRLLVLTRSGANRSEEQEGVC